MPLDENNRFASVPRDVQKAVAQARARLHARQIEIDAAVKSRELARLALVKDLRAAQAEDEAVAKDGLAWLEVYPAEA